MTTKEAIWVLEDGGWWNYLDDNISEQCSKDLHAALDVALTLLREQAQDSCSDENYPLTLGELEGMDGETVWWWREGRWPLRTVCSYRATTGKLAFVSFLAGWKAVYGYRDLINGGYKPHRHNPEEVSRCDENQV